MGLRYNAFGTLKIAGGAYADRFLRRKAFNFRIADNAAGFGQKTSFPQGYQSIARAAIPCFGTSDYIRAQISGDSSLVNTGIQVPMVMQATLVGEGTLNPDAEVGKTMQATVVGVGTFGGDVRNLVSMAATIDAGARPSAFDIAQEVWQAKKAGYPDPLTMGGALNAAGSAGDPWGTDVSTYPPGTAGHILANMSSAEIAQAIMSDPRLLTVAKFLGLK